MIELQKNFVYNADKTGDNNFTQIKKVNTPKGNVYIYHRTRMDGSHFIYEVIIPKILKGGTEVFEKTYEEDQERYPGAAAWGKYGWNCNTLERAEELLKKAVDKLNGEKKVKEKYVPTGRPKGRQAVKRPELVFPTKKTWTMKDLLKINKEYTQPVASLALKPLIGKSVQIVGEKKNKTGRGRAAKVYSTL